jgi:hypothetical protein
VAEHVSLLFGARAMRAAGRRRITPAEWKETVMHSVVLVHGGFVDGSG